MVRTWCRLFINGYLEIKNGYLQMKMLREIENVRRFSQS